MRVEGLLDKDKSNCFSFVISILLLYYSGAMLLDCFYKHKKIQVHVKLFQFNKMHLFIIEQYPLHYDIHKNNIMFMRKLEWFLRPNDTKTDWKSASTIRPYEQWMPFSINSLKVPDYGTRHWLPYQYKFCIGPLMEPMAVYNKIQEKILCHCLTMNIVERYKKIHVFFFTDFSWQWWFLTLNAY